MLTCNDANVLIVRTIDDALSGGERAALRRHLVSCVRCRAEYETQHEVRRLLVLHIQDRLPAGFDERLSVRLARISRPQSSDAIRGTPTPAPLAAPRWAEAADARQWDTRGRMWALRLIPLAATLALIVAGTSVRDTTPRPVASSDAPFVTPPPRTFTTIVLPRSDRASRRQRPSAVSSEDVALAPVQPLLDDVNGGDRETGAVAESGAAHEPASRAAKVLRATADADASDRVRAPASEPRGRERERVASRADDARGERVGDERAEGERAEGERAASQQPGILPRPAVPVPLARPAMPAPPAGLPDRTIPPP